jgi:hypothetical protein
MSSSNENYDEYGFNKDISYDREDDYPSLKPDISVKKFAMYLVIGVIVFFLLLTSVIAGYHAWNEFPNDKTLIKVIKSYVAVLFSPFYLFYVFLKVQLFKKQ